MRYWALEHHIAGNWQKFNNNKGFQAPGETESNLVAQAFSHWTFDKTHREDPDNPIVVCDIQGVGTTWTDPAIVSVKKGTEGQTDGGIPFQQKFLGAHQCNRICRGLDLKTSYTVMDTAIHVGVDSSGDNERSNSSMPTSAVPIFKSRHLHERGNERNIGTRVCQAAVKHGTKVTQHQGRVRHEHNGVVYITDDSRKIGITAWRKQPLPQQTAVTMVVSWAANPRLGFCNVADRQVQLEEGAFAVGDKVWATDELEYSCCDVPVRTAGYISDTVPLRLTGYVEVEWTLPGQSARKLRVALPSALGHHPDNSLRKWKIGDTISATNDIDFSGSTAAASRCLSSIDDCLVRRGSKGTVVDAIETEVQVQPNSRWDQLPVPPKPVRSQFKLPPVPMF